MGFHSLYASLCSAIFLFTIIQECHMFRFVSYQYRRQMLPQSNLISTPDVDPFTSTMQVDSEAMKAYSCSLMVCQQQDLGSPVCACNFNTGNAVSFKNECDVRKHNCRFDTDFKVMLNEICPWEFQSRRLNNALEFDYSDSKCRIGSTA